MIITQSDVVRLLWLILAMALITLLLWPLVRRRERPLIEPPPQVDWGAPTGGGVTQAPQQEESRRLLVELNAERRRDEERRLQERRAKRELADKKREIYERKQAELEAERQRRARELELERQRVVAAENARLANPIGHFLQWLRQP